MTKDEMQSLKTGDLVQHSTDLAIYVVSENYGNRVTAVRTVDITNPAEWKKVTSIVHNYEADAIQYATSCKVGGLAFLKAWRMRDWQYISTRHPKYDIPILLAVPDVEHKKLFGRIRVGASIMQDRAFGNWPECRPPKGRVVDPDMIFEVTWNGRYWDCRANGFGQITVGALDQYGNGSIFVNDFNGVLLVFNEHV
jgi:hypothetical protein